MESVEKIIVTKVSQVEHVDLPIDFWSGESMSLFLVLYHMYFE